MEDGVSVGFEMPGQGFDFEEVTSVFEQAATGTLAYELMFVDHISFHRTGG